MRARRFHYAPQLCAAALLLVLTPTSPAADQPVGADFFDKRIRPVLVEHC
jgi:hypothetical protein